MQKYGKKVVSEYEKYLDNEQFKVIVTYDPEADSTKETYYNIHVISERFKDDELNTLKLQEPKSAIENPKEYFNNARMIGYLMEHFIWDRFYNEGIFNGYVVSEFDSY